MEKAPENMTNEELQAVIDEGYKQWDKNNTVWSLSDFEECVRELKDRENQ